MGLQPCVLPSCKTSPGLELPLYTPPPDYFPTYYSTLLPFVPTMPRAYMWHLNKYQPITTLRNVYSITCPPCVSSVYRW